MILSDRTIKKKIEEGKIVIEPFSEEFLQPASYDLHLDNKILVFDTNGNGYIDVKEKSAKLMREIEVDE